MPQNILNEPQLPFALQTYLWRQLRPFIRPKLGRVHEASCVEMKEACTSLERVLVQNIHNELSPNLKNILSSVPRWRLIQASLPFVLQASASLLHTKKDFQNLGPQETTLLYILHWIILDAAEECSSDQNGNSNNPFHYLFSVPTITLFVHLFVPLCNQMKDIDFKGSLRLENGQKIWYPIYECRHPEAPCFTAHCRPKPRSLWKPSVQSSRAQNISDDVFLGANGSPPSHTGSGIFSDQGVPLSTRVYDDDSSWVSSPKDKAFPETIPEESSSTEDEHVVIFTIPSLDKPEKMLEGVREVSTIYAGEASIFHVAMGEIGTSTKPTLTIEQVTSTPDLDVSHHYESKSSIRKTSDATRDSDGKWRPERDAKTDATKSKRGGQKYPSSGDGQAHQSIVDLDVRAATFLDVAVMKCLFASQWQEEGFFWSLQFLYNRLRRMNEDTSAQQTPRRRSNSLPIPKIEVSLYQSPESTRKGDGRDTIDSPNHRNQAPTTDKAETSDEFLSHDTKISHTRKVSERTKRRMRIADLKAFVETKLLSKSEKALEKIGHESQTSLHEEEYHRSLDTGQRRLTRQPSVCSRTSDDQDPDVLEHESNLVKGKSMPSLSCLNDELASDGYMGEIKIERKQSQIDTQTSGPRNPIITVTEHTPTPSPDYMRKQGSMDSQSDIVGHGRRRGHDRKPSLTRSQTDSNITYLEDEINEAPGCNYFITEDGDIDLRVVLEAVHNVAQRDTQTCTLRTCELILNLLELLIDMGVLKYSSEGMEGNSGA